MSAVSTLASPPFASSSPLPSSFVPAAPFPPVDLRAQAWQQQLIEQNPTPNANPLPIYNKLKRFLCRTRLGASLSVFVASLLILLIVKPAFVQKTATPLEDTNYQPLSVPKWLVWSLIPAIVTFVVYRN
jgi:hypothetical protein